MKLIYSRKNIPTKLLQFHAIYCYWKNRFNLLTHKLPTPLNTINCQIKLDCGTRVPRFNSRLWKRFVCCFLLLCFNFLVHKALFTKLFAIPFCNVNSFSILLILQNLSPFIRVSRYRPSILMKKMELLRKLVNRICHYFFT